MDAFMSTSFSKERFMGWASRRAVMFFIYKDLL